ncbi:MAG TPA: type II toxin-antitoxin system prevent-host-death family antitoxin [Microbacterium sp.]|jgi:prevent-host-death family protein|nr:type II toxin-antitoxin system prevent-host-death family antitoxin [Microbacterium sp.]
MNTIGIRELRQDASGAVRRVSAGESLVVTDRGRPVAQLVPATSSGLAHLLAIGAARPALESIADLPQPVEGNPLSRSLHDLRDEERY